MKTRFILFRRAGVYYCEDTTTGKQSSLRTKGEAEANAILNARNESFRQPVLNLQIARAYLAASDPTYAQRTWQTVMEQFQTNGKEATRTRYVRAMKSKVFDGLRGKKLIETNAEDFLAVLNNRQVSVSHFLKRVHNLALSFGWLALPVLPRDSGRNRNSNPSAALRRRNIRRYWQPSIIPNAISFISCFGKSAPRRVTLLRSPPRILTGRRSRFPIFG